MSKRVNPFAILTDTAGLHDEAKSGKAGRRRKSSRASRDENNFPSRQAPKAAEGDAP